MSIISALQIVIWVASKPDLSTEVVCSMRTCMEYSEEHHEISGSKEGVLALGT